MAYENKAALKVAIADNLNRADLTDLQLNRFIRDAETRANRLLRLREDVCISTAPVPAGAEFVALPTNYAGVTIVRFTDGTTDDITDLRAVSNAVLAARRNEAVDGTPEFYTEVRNQYWLAPSPTNAGTLEIFVKERFELATDADSNALLQKNADIYLHGALYEAKTFLREDLAEITAHEQRFLTGIRELRISDWHDRAGGQLGEGAEFF